LKKDIPLSSAHRIINHGPVVLVTSQSKDRTPNILAVAWVTPLSQNPPLAGVSIAKSHYSHELILESHEFVINVPSGDLIRHVYTVGRISGRDEDKFVRIGLTPIPGQKVLPPLIGECIGHLECRVDQAVDAGDHTFFVGRVVRACAEDGLFHETWDLAKAGELHHLGGEWFSVSGQMKKAGIL
jgi:flavin reductase (DIM6/NTAB) family NADH-FMN oxidoreductase RutF